ncbi:MAG: tetratricopeptide repeat protein [Gemmatimonadaceae bacterium]
MLRALAQRIDQHDPRAFNNLGVLYHSKGMHADAVDALLKALAIDPRMQTAARNLEVVAASDGACDVRLAELAERIARNADDRAAGREQARLLRLIGRTIEASQKLDALIAEDPDDAAALLERGLLEQRAGDLRRAQRWFERATSANVEEPMARLHLAEVLYQRGQNEQALDALDELLLLDDEIADAHMLRGFVLGDMGRHEAGMEAARRASALNPAEQSAQPNLSLEKLTPRSVQAVSLRSMPSAVSVAATMTSNAGIELARYGLGLAFRQRGYFAEARREFERALAAGEDARLVRHAIAELDIVAGNSGDAVTAYGQLLLDYGEQARWRNELGVAEHQRGGVELAAESYRRALRCDPRHALAYNNLGVALADLGDAVAAREAFQQAVAINPTLVRTRLNLARWLSQNGDPLAALALLRELASFHGQVAEVWFDLGVVLAALKRNDDAQQALTSALELRPDHSEARYALADLLRARGDADGASRESQSARALAPRRGVTRLSVGIDLQDECPDAVGGLELLPTAPVLAFAGNACEEAETFASRSLHGEALARYEEVRMALELSGPRNVWRRAAIGEARSRCMLGRGAEALELLERVLKSSHTGSSDDSEVLALIAAAQASAAKTNDVAARLARVAIERFMRLDSRSAALLHFVGDVALSLNDDALAIILFRRALAVDPTRPSPRVAIARMLRRRNDMLAARLELVAALSAAPTWRDGLLELARLHCDAERAHDAMAILVTHLNRVPNDAEALALLAGALLKVGREKDARLALERALRHDATNSEALQLQATMLSTSAGPLQMEAA